MGCLAPDAFLADRSNPLDPLFVLTYRGVGALWGIGVPPRQKTRPIYLYYLLLKNKKSSNRGLRPIPTVRIVVRIPIMIQVDLTKGWGGFGGSSCVREVSGLGWVWPDILRTLGRGWYPGRPGHDRVWRRPGRAGQDRAPVRPVVHRWCALRPGSSWSPWS